MSPKCTICQHKEREKIDALILEGVSVRNIAKQYSVDYQAVNRHRKKHLPEYLTRAREAEEITQASSLLSDLEGLRQQALWFLEKAKEKEDLKAASSLISSACKVLELLGEVRNELDRKQTLNIILSPEWIKIQTVIFTSLEQYPEARIKLSQALKEIEGQ